MNHDGLALLTWCAPWLVAVPVAAVRRISDAPIGEGLDLAIVLGLPPAAGHGSWLVIDREPGLALRVDRCLHLIRPGAIRPVPASMRRRDLALHAFLTPDTVAGLAEVPPVGLWLDPRLIAGGHR